MNPDLEKVNSLAVHLHGRRIGIINRLAGDRYLFAFEQDYVNDPDRPTLSLSYKGQAGGLVTAVHTVGRRLRRSSRTCCRKGPCGYIWRRRQA